MRKGLSGILAGACICVLTVSGNAISKQFDLSGNALLISGTTSMPKSFTKGDTEYLSPYFASPFYYLSPQERGLYFATKFNPASSCSLMRILFGIADTMAGSKQCSVFVWADGSNPGTRLCSGIMTMNATTANTIYWSSFTLPTPLYMNSSFWVGIKENDTLLPTMVIDTFTISPVQYSQNGSSWTASTFGLIQEVFVKYDSTAKPTEPRMVVVEDFTGTG